MSERDQIRERKAEELKNKLGGEGNDDESTSDRNEPVHVESTEHLQELVDEGGVVLTDFYADWCGPCKMLEPIVAEIAAETDATVAKVDVDAQQRLAQQYRVQGVPTMYLFADGEQVEQLVGVRQKDQLVSLIQQYA
ncbi:thioredoxin [Halobaculum rubrum]|uniref:thioredoxin n=1 Tax=Halobaculum rubrum TaxID=2872158 RepID=UPI001CA44A6A|nr:thioredoxin [Halobaculum rubrum]QZX99153.1 thioredoxin [Halobaculum rubrum]